MVGEKTGITSGSTTSSSITRTDDQQSAAVAVFGKASGNVSATSTLTGTGAVSSASLVQLALPINFTATPVSTTQINLAWDAVTGATGYEVERDSSVIAYPATNSYNDTGRTASTQYSYRVRATS